MPSTVLRASQFHSLVLRLFTAQRRLPVLLVLPVPVPGRTGRAYRGGAHLAPEHADGRVSFDEFLELSRSRA